MEARVIERYENKGQVKEVRSLLLDTYKPEPFDRKGHNFISHHPPPFMQKDPMEQWAHTITGQLEIIPVPGDHMSALQPPYVALLAGTIEKLLPHNENG